MPQGKLASYSEVKYFSFEAETVLLSLKPFLTTSYFILWLGKDNLCMHHYRLSFLDYYTPSFAKYVLKLQFHLYLSRRKLKVSTLHVFEILLHAVREYTLRNKCNCKTISQ